MQLWLVDINPILVKAWKSTFYEFSNVNVIEADILSIAENTIVSPANSYGFMDGGIDQFYTDYFGLGPQRSTSKSHCYTNRGIFTRGCQYSGSNEPS
ncbi:MAG TPA: hypothetical protein EYP59_12595 [Thiotrichaceae bacterium]|nr:hypothetical protein [Thiotrichaceae bacterium]